MRISSWKDRQTIELVEFSCDGKYFNSNFILLPIKTKLNLKEYSNKRENTFYGKGTQMDSRR
jgi:hypothetical protein